MSNFVFSEANVKKNYFRIFVKTLANIAAHPTEPEFANGLAVGVDDSTGVAGISGPLASGFIKTLYDNYYEQIGSCKSEPKISSTDVEGIKNNIGTSLGASKEVTVEFNLIDLDGGVEIEDNYLSTLDLEGKAANYVFVDEKSGVCHYVRGVVASVNLSTVGNSFEELPVVAKKEAATISAVTNRYKMSTGATVIQTGKVGTVQIMDAGLGYDAADILTQIGLVSGGSGSGFSATVDTVGVNGNILTLVAPFTAVGANYRVGDIIFMSLGSSPATRALKLRVLTVTA